MKNSTITIWQETQRPLQYNAFVNVTWRRTADTCSTRVGWHVKETPSSRAKCALHGHRGVEGESTSGGELSEEIHRLFGARSAARALTQNTSKHAILQFLALASYLLQHRYTKHVRSYNTIGCQWSQREILTRACNCTCVSVFADNYNNLYISFIHLFISDIRASKAFYNVLARAQ